MKVTPNTLGQAVEPANKFTPDAQQWMTRLRAMAAEFPDEADPKLLTLAEIRLARSTSAATLENAAALIEVAPAIAGAVAVDATGLRDAISFELAYGSVRAGRLFLSSTTRRNCHSYDGRCHHCSHA